MLRRFGNSLNGNVGGGQGGFWVATALDGYQRFRDRQKAVSEGHPDPESELLAVIGDYFAFGRDEPRAFTLIFNSNLTRRSRRIDPWARYENALRLVSQITATPADHCANSRSPSPPSPSPPSPSATPT